MARFRNCLAIPLSHLGWSLSDANRLRASSFSALAVNISARGFCMFPLCPQVSTNAPAQPPRATDIWHATETLSRGSRQPACWAEFSRKVVVGARAPVVSEDYGALGTAFVMGWVVTKVGSSYDFILNIARVLFSQQLRSRRT